MQLERNEVGDWQYCPGVELDQAIEQGSPHYIEAMPRYLNALEPAFKRAIERSEFNFIESLLGVRGLQNAGWDPYESTIQAIDAATNAHSLVDATTKRHLTLWIYGHIMEASEPYEFLANLVEIAGGGRYSISRFPTPNNRPPVSPYRKIINITERAAMFGIPGVEIPMQEAWNRELRNAIFHADYCLFGPQVRIRNPDICFEHEEIEQYINRALAYHQAMIFLRQRYTEQYTEPKVIPADPEFTGNNYEQAVVIVREGHGVVGIKDNWTLEELARGGIPYRSGRFSRDESELLRENPTLALLPRRGEN